MFSNVIQQGSSPGGRRRGLIWQSGDGPIQRYVRALWQLGFRSYGGDAFYAQCYPIATGVQQTWYDEAKDAIKIDWYIGSSHYEQWMKPVRLPYDEFYEDTFASWNDIYNIWELTAYACHMSSWGNDYAYSPRYGDRFHIIDTPGWHPTYPENPGLTAQDILSVETNALGSAYSSRPYYIKWVAQNMLFRNRGTEYTASPPGRVYVNLMADQVRAEYPGTILYDSQLQMYYMEVDQTPIEVVRASEPNCILKDDLNYPPTTIGSILTTWDFLVHKRHTHLLPVN